jgi:hypothetical protein
VARTEALPYTLLFRKGKKTSRGGYFSALYDHGSVVEGAVEFKYRHDKAGRNFGVHPCPRIYDVPYIYLPGKHDQHAPLLLRKNFSGGYRRLKLPYAGFVVRPEKFPLAQPYDDLAQFGLKDYRDGDKNSRPHRRKDPAEGRQFEKKGDAVHKGKKTRPLDKLNRLRLYQKFVGFIQKKSENGHIQNGADQIVN